MLQLIFTLVTGAHGLPVADPCGTKLTDGVAVAIAANDDERSDRRRRMLAVDPEDEYAILDFINGVEPLPGAEVAFGLHATLFAFWRTVRPDFDSTRINERLTLFKTSRYALKLLRGKQPQRRPELGRLTLTWIEIVRDVTGVDLAARDPGLLHRARALVVLQRSGAITAFLADTLGHRVPPSVAGVQTALVELYAAHLPAVTPPAADLSLTFKYDVHAEITRLWAAYVDDLTQFRARVENRPPPPVPTIKFTAVDSLPADPRGVPTEPKLIIEWLVLNIDQVKPTDDNALAAYLRAARTRYGLAPHGRAVKRRDFTNIWHHNFPRSRQRLSDAWAEFIGDLGRR